MASLGVQGMTALPIQPLLELTAGTGTLAQRLGVTRRTVQRDALAGLSVEKAERYADALGVMPCDLWPDWYDRLLVEVGKPCPECGTFFVPSGRQKYCTTRCRSKATARRLRADPGYRERQRAYVREYRKGARETLRAYRRRYYLANRERLLAEQRVRDIERRGQSCVRCVRCKSVYLIPVSSVGVRFEAQRAVDWFNTHECEDWL